MIPHAFQANEALALRLDAEDPLRSYRDRFHLPPRPDGQSSLYFCTHSLGPQPKAVRALMEEELDAWARLGVEGHFRGRAPWYTYGDLLRDAAARLVGARPDEVVLMNTLTVNLHLMLMTFYRPRPGRDKLLIDEPPFPSDLYAVQSQLQQWGLDPGEALLSVGPRSGEHALRTEDVADLLERRGREIALVLFNAVNYRTGQALDIERLTALAHRQGCVAGFDLAHAAGNVVLHLHDWQVDFAVWCSYKYLCAGPGALAGCFVHERHGRDLTLPRLAGWWGNDPATRFQRFDQREFVPQSGAAGWQVSNPPILALVPLRASLALFDEAGMPALRAKSERLTAYLESLLDQLPAGRCEVITPRDPAARGCQLSIRVPERPRELLHALEEAGVVCDFREPDVIRVAPVPLFNTFHEVWQFARLLAERQCG
jgi:kynureninase